MRRNIVFSAGMLLVGVLTFLTLPHAGRAAEGQGAATEPPTGATVHVEIERADTAGSRVVSADGTLRMLTADWVAVESNQGIGTVWFPRSRVTVIVVKP